MRVAVTSAGVERVEKVSEGEQRLWLITPLLEQQTCLNTIKFYVAVVNMCRLVSTVTTGRCIFRTDGIRS